MTITKAELVEQPAYRCLAQPNMELTPNEFSYHRTRPQSERKLHLQGVFRRHSIVYPFDHLPCQLRRTATPLVCIQGLPAATSIPGKPAEQSRPVYPEHLGHHIGPLPILNCMHSTLPQFSKFIVRKPSGISLFHVSMLTHRGHYV